MTTEINRAIIENIILEIHTSLNIECYKFFDLDVWELLNYLCELLYRGINWERISTNCRNIIFELFPDWPNLTSKMIITEFKILQPCKGYRFPIERFNRYKSIKESISDYVKKHNRIGVTKSNIFSYLFKTYREKDIFKLVNLINVYISKDEYIIRKGRVYYNLPF
jgi:hypothetical protein